MAKQSTILLIAVFLFLSCSGDNDLLQRKKDIEIKSFLSFYQKQILKKDSLILLKNAFDYDYPNCLERFKKEPIFKGFNEKDFTLSETFTWDKNDFPNARILLESEIPDYRIPMYWINFLKENKQGYYVFSKPIISTDLNRILFYNAYYCGDRCGYGTFALYEKTDSGWKLVEKYSDWVA